MKPLRYVTYSALLALSFCLFSCSDEKDPVTSTRPVLTVTPIDMAGGLNPVDSTLGDIKFSLPVFIPFGVIRDQTYRTTGIEYYTRLDAPVRAVTAGIIDTIITNPDDVGDYNIVVVCMPGSDYTVYHDHVTRLRVLEHTRVSPGDTLGEAGPWSDVMCRTGFRISYGLDSDLRYYCPLDFGDVSFRELHMNLFAEYSRMGLLPAYDSLCLYGPFAP